MFRLIPSPTFTVRVPLSVPGVEKPLEVPIEFRYRTPDALVAFMARMPGRSDVDNLHDVIVGWSGVAGADGEPIAYSHSNLATLLAHYKPAAKEIFAVYTRELSEAKAKN
jgi:hypothetical protein